MLGTPGEKFANSVSKILGCTVNATKWIFLRLFLKDGLWKGRFLSWINVKDYEKIVNDI